MGDSLLDGLVIKSRMRDSFLWTGHRMGDSLLYGRVIE